MSGSSEAVAVEHDAIGAVAQRIKFRGAEDAVAGERISPFTEVQITGPDRRRVRVPLCDQVVEVFVLQRAQGLEGEVVDDEDLHAGKLFQFALVSTGRPRCLQAAQ